MLNALGRMAVQRPAREPISILDVGTGSADVPRAIARWARRKGLIVKITACDMHSQVARVAQLECADEPDIRIIQADITRLPFPTGSFDFAICSLLLHHLAESQVRTALCELRRTARHGVIVSDLVRGWLPYAGVVLATHMLSRNVITRNDGPLSVRRAYTVVEMRKLADEAGYPDLVLHSRPGFRMVGVGPGSLATAAQAATLAGTRRERDFAIQTATR